MKNSAQKRGNISSFTSKPYPISSLKQVIIKYLITLQKEAMLYIPKAQSSLGQNPRVTTSTLKKSLFGDWK